MPLGASTNGTTHKEDKEERRIDFEFVKGSRIAIPEDMTMEEAAKAIDRQIEEDSVIVNINEPIDAFPHDGAVALMKALKAKYGWTHLVPKDMGFWGTKPPTMISVEVGPGPNDRIQVPWGQCQIPKVDGTIETGVHYEDDIPKFKISGQVKRKDERTIHEIARLVREFVKEESVYRRKAVKLNFRDSEGNRKDFDMNFGPKFMDLSSIQDQDPIFSKTVEDAIRVNLFNPIRYMERCRKKGATLKKGIMLGGPFGTGKTLTSYQTARLAAEHGWTFLYVEDVRDLDLAINFARLYQPCVLFAEDADRVAAGPRTPEMDKLLNTIDGVESKGDHALLMVLTTNHIEIINRAFMRPGRINAVINVVPPDLDACIRIVRKYISQGGCQAEGTDEQIGEAIKPLVGATASFFSTAVDQAKLSAIESMESDDADIIIRPDDLRIASEGMVPHAKLINPEHGKKGLLDLDGDETLVDPMKFVMDVFGQKMAESLLSNIVKPQMLQKVILKGMKRPNRGDPSMN
jgi:transitional endoplasmic reticulum ATPase